MPALATVPPMSTPVDAPQRRAPRAAPSPLTSPWPPVLLVALLLLALGPEPEPEEPSPTLSRTPASTADPKAVPEDPLLDS